MSDSEVRYTHDCPDCTHPRDDYEPGTLLRVGTVLWFKGKKDTFAWSIVYGSLRWESGGYNMPPLPHVFVAVLDESS